MTMRYEQKFHVSKHFVNIVSSRSFFSLIIFIGYDETVVTPFDLSWSEDLQFQSIVYYIAHFCQYTSIRLKHCYGTISYLILTHKVSVV